MVGDDAKDKWSSYDAYHIAKHREYDTLMVEVPTEEQEELIDTLPLFDSEKRELAEDCGWNSNMHEYENKGKPLKFSQEEKEKLDTIVNNLVTDIKSYYL